MTKPRRCSQQIYQSNHPVQNTKKYFCVSLTIRFLDHVSADLEYRFPGDELTQYRGLELYHMQCQMNRVTGRKNL